MVPEVINMVSSTQQMLKSQSLILLLLLLFILPGLGSFHENGKAAMKEKEEAWTWHVSEDLCPSPGLAASQPHG